MSSLDVSTYPLPSHTESEVVTMSHDQIQPDVQTQSGNEPCTMRVLDRQELLSLGAEWEELVAEALEENAYFCRQYLEALLTHVEQKTAIKALVVYRGPRLIAFLPYVTERWRWLGFTEVNMALLTPYASLAIPLIDQRDSKAAIYSLVSAMNNGSGRDKIWILPYVNLDGPVNRLLVQGLKKRGLTFTPLDVFDCPVLVKQNTFEEHIKNHATKNRRKGLARNRKRLAEIGSITEGIYTEGTDLDTAVEEFLRIEAAGWKGKQGTALDSTSSTRNFAKQAFGVHKGKSITRAHLLLLNKQARQPSLSKSRTMNLIGNRVLECSLKKTWFETCLRETGLTGSTPPRP